MLILLPYKSPRNHLYFQEMVEAYDTFIALYGRRPDNHGEDDTERRIAHWCAAAWVKYRKGKMNDSQTEKFEALLTRVNTSNPGNCEKRWIENLGQETLDFVRDNGRAPELLTGTEEEARLAIWLLQEIHISKLQRRNVGVLPREQLLFEKIKRLIPLDETPLREITLIYAAHFGKKPIQYGKAPLEKIVYNWYSAIRHRHTSGTLDEENTLFLAKLDQLTEL